MTTRKRDYRTEYARRITLATQKGVSRSAARGHPKAGERQKPPSAKTVDPYSREEQALRMMRRGGSLREASNHYRMSQERLRAYIKETTGATRENGRWKIVDHRSRQFPFYSDGEVAKPWMSLDQASEVGRYMQAVKQFLRTGDTDRRHVFVDTIEDIGKESDGWEEDDTRTEDQDTVLIYPSSSFDRERMIERIKSAGMLEVKREARIAMRTINAVWKGQEVREEHLKRMADAADRIASRCRKREDEQAAAVEWLRAKRDEMGLTALAKLVGVDAANLAKVIDGKRKPSRELLQQFL